MFIYIYIYINESVFNLHIPITSITNVFLHSLLHVAALLRTLNLGFQKRHGGSGSASTAEELEVGVLHFYSCEFFLSNAILDGFKGTSKEGEIVQTNIFAFYFQSNKEVRMILFVLMIRRM